MKNWHDKVVVSIFVALTICIIILTFQVGAAIQEAITSQEINKNLQLIIKQQNKLQNEQMETIIEQQGKIKELESQLERIKELESQLERIKELESQLERIKELESQLERIKEELEKWEIIELEVTAYAPSDNKSGICADENSLITASGTSPSHGTVAVNPKVIPYGTRMYIPGYGWGVAEDTGAAIRQRTDLIDIYMDKHYQALEWGRQELEILIEGNGG